MTKEHHHLPKDPLTSSPPRRTTYITTTTNNPLRALCSFLLTLLLLAGIIVLILWLIYRPHKPRFTVVRAAIYTLNVSTPPFLSATMQFTLLARNPNRRTSIYYDRLYAYVTYRDQVITTPISLPPLHQDTKSTVAMFPVLGDGGGGGVPVPVEVANGLSMDEGYGVVALKVAMVGKVRWKAGGITTRRYGFRVKCDVLLGLKKGFVGEVPLLTSYPCKVHV